MKRILFASLLAPLLLCGSCKEDDATPKAYPDQLPTAEKFPVVAWLGVHSDFASIERFKQAEQMGITLNYSRMQNVETALKMLDMAAKTNVKLIPEIVEIVGDNASTEGRAAAVKALMNHPALAGYFIDDETHPSQFDWVAKAMKDVQSVDKAHFCYGNLLPSGGPEQFEQLGVANYREYVEKFLNTCPVTFVSFDRYPVAGKADGTAEVLPQWFESLEVCSAIAKERKMDLWAFLLTVPHLGYPVPTKEHLRLQAYCNLAYGTQVLQCFTYWTPAGPPASENYRLAPIEKDGTQTPTYDLVKDMLLEVQNLAWVFRGCTMENVWHLTPGASVPESTTPLTKLPDMAEQIMIGSDESVLVSVLKNHGYTFMVVVNTSVTNNARATIKMKKDVRFINHTGKVTLASNESATQIITPGDLRIYMW